MILGKLNLSTPEEIAKYLVDVDEAVEYYSCIVAAVNRAEQLFNKNDIYNNYIAEVLEEESDIAYIDQLINLRNKIQDSGVLDNLYDNLCEIKDQLEKEYREEDEHQRQLQRDYRR